MGTSAGRKSHEHYLLFAGLSDLPAGEYTSAVGKYNFLEQDSWIVGRNPFFVIAVAGIEDREIKFGVDQMVQGIFKRVWNNLLFEEYGNDRALHV